MFPMLLLWSMGSVALSLGAVMVVSLVGVVVVIVRATIEKRLLSLP
jgi:hypothetical protein